MALPGWFGSLWLTRFSRPAGERPIWHHLLRTPPQRILDTFADHGVIELAPQLPTAEAAGIPETGPAEELAPGPRAEVLRCCLEAHRNLMALKPENVAKFQMVEQYLARELAKESGTPESGTVG
jgi:hypothetical protein